MKFIADINVTQTVIKNLRQSGHNVLDIKTRNSKISDTGLIKLAQKEKRIIVTHDKDFENLAIISRYQVGIIAIRLKVQNAQHHWEKLKILLSNTPENELKKSLTIITEQTTDQALYK